MSEEFLPVFSHKNKLVGGAYRKFTYDYGLYHRVVDVLVQHTKLSMLLQYERQRKEKSRGWSLVGGHVEFPNHLNLLRTWPVDKSCRSRLGDGRRFLAAMNSVMLLGSRDQGGTTRGARLSGSASAPSFARGTTSAFTQRPNRGMAGSLVV